MANAIISVIFAAVGLSPASPPVTETKEVMPSAPELKRTIQDDNRGAVANPGLSVNGEAQSSPNDVADKSPGAPTTRQGSEATPKSVEAQIRAVFGIHGNRAVRVARCESTLRVSARNGQHRGLFQLGRVERAEYGHGSDALTQIKAAYELFLDRGFQPWRACL